MKGHTPHSLEYLPIISDGAIKHYTCNAPSQCVLDKFGVKSIGDKFGCANLREVVEIPLRFYESQGFKMTQDKFQLILNLEILIKRLS